MKVLLVASLMAVTFGNSDEQMDSTDEPKDSGDRPVPQAIVISVDLRSGRFTNPYVDFMKTYNKLYKSQSEGRKRYSAFMKNYKFVKDHNNKYNNGIVAFNVAINEFADLSSEEFSAKRRCVSFPAKFKRSGKMFVVNRNVKINSTVDWVRAGAVTPVKAQQNCSDCWIFSATESVEGQYFLKTKKLVSLSEQNLVDCLGKKCHRAMPQVAFDYIKKHGIATEKSYPYEGKLQKCKYNKKNKAVTIRGYEKIEASNETKLKHAVATKGPISVLIDASKPTFQFFSGGGVYDDPSCENGFYSPNHAVLVVGYGTTSDGIDYWLVKNSWGKNWGDNGYIKMSRNKGNQCGIANHATYPVM